ncbi:hypothetical protein TNCV_71621 [Trichonephila clavipes]|nr:hypothetical protein TNCV_71621 [Trichonephila clavipes]
MPDSVNAEVPVALPKTPQDPIHSFVVVVVANATCLTYASSAIVQKEVSFAKALKNDKQMVPPLDKSEPAQSKPKATPTPKENRNLINSKSNESENFGFMDTILELKKFFTDYPSLLELSRQLRNAQGNERVDVFYRHLISLN